jgi:hypothetical protein
MATLPDAWAAYARLQARLSRRNELDHYTWGLENGLNLILADHFSASEASDGDFSRAVASAARKERDHSQRFLLEGTSDEDVEDPHDFDARMAARDVLTRVAARVREADSKLLGGLATGLSYDEIASQLGGTAVGMRTRVLRLRQALAYLNA